MGCCATRDKSISGGKRTTIGVSNAKAAAAVNRMKEENAKIEKFVTRIIAEGKPWTDPEFPPKMQSLFDPNIDEGDESKYADYEWKRFSQIYKKPALFQGGIHPNDINQGALGDCYFLAVLSSLAEFPDRVSALFYTKEINSAGIYLVRFFVNGTETPVIVDDYLPCKNGRPVFASSRDDELWVSVLEKAWAKLHGTYARTEGGLPCFACSHLVGVPSESILHDEIENREEFWDMLQPVYWQSIMHSLALIKRRGQNLVQPIVKLG